MALYLAPSQSTSILAELIATPSTQQSKTESIEDVPIQTKPSTKRAKRIYQSS